MSICSWLIFKNSIFLVNINLLFSVPEMWSFKYTQKCVCESLLIYLNWVCGIWTFCFWEWPLSLTMKKLFYQLNVFLTHTYDLSFFFFETFQLLFSFYYIKWFDVFQIKEKYPRPLFKLIPRDNFCLHHFEKPNYLTKFSPYTKNYKDSFLTLLQGNV